MTSQETGSEISPRELEREALKKKLEKITSWSFDHSSATPRPAESTRVDAEDFMSTHADIFDAIKLHEYDLFDMLPDKDAFLNDPHYFTGGEDRVITHEGKLYLIEQILTIIENYGFLDGVDQEHPGFSATVETFLPADNRRATLDAITALQLVARESAEKRLRELYKPKSHSYITSTAVGANRRMVRSGYSPRKDGITLTDRYASVFSVNKTNTVSIDGKPVTYDQVGATLLGKPVEFYETFEKINDLLEVTPEIIGRLQNYIGLKINTPEFWGIRDDDDKSDLQALLTELSEASDNATKKKIFSEIIKRIFSNVDISPNIDAMTSGGDKLAAGMPVQARLQEWGRIVFGNESHTEDGETPAFSKEASIDLRSAQALFNILIPPESLKDLYIIDHEIATLRKPYDDEIQKVNETTIDEASRKKQLEDIYKRMNRDQQLSEKIVKKTDLRTLYYDAILEAYNVEEPEGFKTAEGGDHHLIDQIRERKALLKGKTWDNIHTESETELLKLFSDTDSDENAIRARIKGDRKRTRGPFLRLEERFGPNFIKNNRAGNDVVIGMGLKGIELLKRRAQSNRMRNTETVEHDLDAIMARTLPTEVTVYGRVESTPIPQEPASDLTELLQRLKDTAGTGPADEQDEKAARPPEKEINQAQSERPPVKQDTRAEASGTNDYARLYKPNYGNLPKSSNPEASSAVEIAIHIMDEGNIDESLEWFRRALNHDHADLQAMFGIAVTTGDVREQIAMLEHILKKQPNFKAANVLLSNLLSETHGATPPVSVEEPPHPNAPYIEITKLMQDPIPENQRKARELAEGLTTKNDKDAEAWYLRAMLIRGTDKGAIDVKKRHLKRALKADPHHQPAKDELEKLTRTSSTAQTQENASITRHPLMSRIEEANLNKSAQEALEQVKESTDISDWIDRIMTKETTHRLLTSEDPADSKLNDLKKIIDNKAKEYTSYMEERFEWPETKHKENLQIIQGIMLFELRQLVDRYRQAPSEKPAGREDNPLALTERLHEALLSGEKLFVATNEIQQAFIDNNDAAINQYLTEARTILTVDATTLPDYDDRHFDQIRAEGIKTMYLQILDSAIQNRAHKQLLIDRLEQHGIPDLFASVLQEDMRRLSPTQVIEADYNNHSARLFGVAAKIEVMELLLKITTPKYLPVTHHLFAEGSSLRTALEHVTTLNSSSLPGTVVGELESQLQDASKKIQAFITKHESKIKTQADTPPAEKQEQKQEAKVAQAEETIMSSGLLTDDDIQELQRSDYYQKDLTTSVNVIYELLKEKQQLDVIENNIIFSKKIIREAIEQIVSKTPTKIREFNDGKQHRNIPEMIDISAEDTPHDIEQTITVLQTLGYTEDRIAELMQNGRLDFLNLEISSIMHSLKQAHRKHIIDADIYPSKSQLMEALKEMVRRYQQSQ